MGGVWSFQRIKIFGAHLLARPFNPLGTWVREVIKVGWPFFLSLLADCILRFELPDRAFRHVRHDDYRKMGSSEFVVLNSAILLVRLLHRGRWEVTWLFSLLIGFAYNFNLVSSIKFVHSKIHK